MLKLPNLQPGHYYHIYNRGINRENIFIEEKNYHYFFKLYVKYIVPVAQTFAYCLLPNHFHLLVRIRLEPASQAEAHAEQQFSNLFNSYAKSINKAYQRTGGLFQHRFGRIEIKSDQYFLTLINYIHRNPQKHGIINDFRQYAFSSYPALLSQKPTQVDREAVLEWFGSRDQFRAVHEVEADIQPAEHLVGDDWA